VTDSDGALTALLLQWRGGSRDAGNALMAAAYDNLCRLAGHYLQHERRDHTLQATELVNELYLKLFSSGPVEWQDRAHFFAVAGRQLRRILVDHARARRAGKRGGDAIRLSLTEAHGVSKSIDVDVLDVDEALTRLEALDARAASGVELRFFSGLTETEIVEILGVSVATVRRDWKFARAWLISQLTPTSVDEP
jgi:RNA polymerase sigma factor (TIGR02999 family)